MVSKQLCLLLGKGSPSPPAHCFAFCHGPGGAGQPPEQCVSLTPVFVRQHGHAEHMLPVTGVQGCAFPHVLPRSPDWCAQQKGPVLEVSSCAYDR